MKKSNSNSELSNGSVLLKVPVPVDSIEYFKFAKPAKFDVSDAIVQNNFDLFSNFSKLVTDDKFNSVFIHAQLNREIRDGHDRDTILINLDFKPNKYLSEIHI